MCLLSSSSATTFSIKGAKPVSCDTPNRICLQSESFRCHDAASELCQ